MPSYLGFGSTKNFRDYLIGKTLNVPNGPQTFTESSYPVQSLNTLSNIDSPDVDFNRENDLINISKYNTYKPEEFSVVENLGVIPQIKNLKLYPYFTSPTHSLIGMMNISDYEKESDLIKFASNLIKNEKTGPIFSRITQNHFLSTTGNSSLLDVINSGPSTIGNILMGNNPLVPMNYKITSLNSKDEKSFLDIIEGKTLPWDQIEGDYLTNPLKPTVNRPHKETETGKIFQDITGAVGELFGINRRKSQDRKPSDLMIEHMGEGQRQLLYLNIGFSKYGPNYTTSARSNNSSGLFGVVSDILDGKGNELGVEAPYNYSYIGDDRGNSVRWSMSDNFGNQVKSSYYMSLLFDPLQTQVFERSLPISEGGGIGSALTWMSTRSKNRLGLYNGSWGSQSSHFDDVRSTNHEFREGSIMGVTQDLLNSLPNDGLSSRSHVANVIDQTSRFFKDGNKIMSRGSAVKYVGRDGEDVGAEYCRVWTKDRPYFTFGDTMKRQGTIRNFDASVMGGGSRPWNLNIGPMSDGNRSFEGSTNIIKNDEGSGFIAKKYMLSIENLAWKNSNLPGFTFNDLPYSERGPNGGRVMWFPPYDIKVTEQNTANWEANSFLGRPEPIYTYKNTERTGTLGFKVIVDHPSILNLMVRDHFKNMSDEESDEYINAFFSGCEEIDFYDMIRRYTTLDADDINLITQYLNEKNDTEVIKKFKLGLIPPNPPQPITESSPIPNNKTFAPLRLLFPNDIPAGKGVSTNTDYDNVYNDSLGKLTGTYIGNGRDSLITAMDSIISGTTVKDRQDRYALFKKDVVLPIEVTELKNAKIDGYNGFVNQGTESYTNLVNYIEDIKKDIIEGSLQELSIVVESGCSAASDVTYNYKLSLRRTHSIIRKVLSVFKGDNSFDDKWKDIPNSSDTISIDVDKEYSFKDLGFEKDGIIRLTTRSAGEKVELDKEYNCTEINFHNKDLRKFSPIAFGCRQSTIKFVYVKAVLPQEKQENLITDEEAPRTMLLPDGEEVITSKSKKPNIDVMKRIIMKTLSEDYYFKKVEETDPHVYNSLKEKLKYFHPSFHSMTPEGLNARLTFLNQCLRPGDTLPIKGVSDENDLLARNTTFGPPPVSILRIGDFYHSKVVFDNLQINFEDTTWDMNPEGIGMQPMIANVTLQIKFIGGHGLEKPVERLQNALSSNFYANTEMYDERSETTNTKINGQDYEKFTKAFLEELQDNYNPATAESNMANNNSSNLINGVYMGEGVKELSYDKLITEFDDTVLNYFSEYEKLYNVINKKYGDELTTFAITNKLKSTTKFIMGTEQIELIGFNNNELQLKNTILNFGDALINGLNDYSVSDLIGASNIFISQKVTLMDEYLSKMVIKTIKEKITNLITDPNITNFEKIRNQLIRTMDKVNFIVTKGYDAMVDKDVYFKSTLGGFNSVVFKKELTPIINNIGKNNKKIDKIINKKIGTTNNEIIDYLDHRNTISKILSVLLSEEGFVFDDDNFTEEEKSKVNQKIKNFVKPLKDHKFNFDLNKNKKNGKKLSYKVLNKVLITDSETSNEVYNIFKEKLANKTTTLNYYRKNV